jgi:alkanesulfonate monooxygenase SsuD/methylene tetrahydromethanopterin reductase-like flavin-dependent oxidoreductase (luciferase family)
MPEPTSGPEFWMFMPQLRMSFEQIVARARAAERAGLDGIALIDHMAPPGLPDGDFFDAMTTASAVISATTRLKVVHLVLCGAFRHPAVLAKEVASLDHLSGGRFELGMGSGSVPKEFHTFGITNEDAATRSRRLRECLEVMRALLGGEQLDYAGEFYQLHAARQNPPALAGKIPVLIGGAGPKLTMPLVRDFADWWNLPTYAIERFDELSPQAGTARRSIQLAIGLAPSEADVESVTAIAQRRFGGWGGLTVGTANAVVDGLAPFVAAGTERFFIQFSDFGSDATLDGFARDVIPAFR